MHAKSVDPTYRAATKGGKSAKQSGNATARRVRVSGGLVEKGSVTLNAEEFARFETCMMSQRQPSKLMQEGIKLHREWTKKR